MHVFRPKITTIIIERFIFHFELVPPRLVSIIWKLYRYDHLETALVEVLSEQHTPTEVAFVFKHFQGKGSTPVAK